MIKENPYKVVLLIDDMEIDRYITERIIQSTLESEIFYKVSTAEDALEILKQAIEKPEMIPNLIMLDLRLPNKSGLDFLDDFDKLPDAIRKRSQIIILTSNLDSEMNRKAKNNKYVSALVFKPLLVHAIKNICEKKI